MYTTRFIHILAPDGRMTACGKIVDSVMRTARSRDESHVLAGWVCPACDHALIMQMQHRPSIKETTHARR